jgi:hypothetical protein
MANDHDIEEAAPKGLLRRAWKYGSLLAVLAVGAWAGGMFPKTHRRQCHASVLGSMSPVAGLDGRGQAIREGCAVETVVACQTSLDKSGAMLPSARV